jgi:hypothetical protein
MAYAQETNWNKYLVVYGSVRLASNTHTQTTARYMLLDDTKLNLQTQHKSGKIQTELENIHLPWFPTAHRVF